MARPRRTRFNAKVSQKPGLGNWTLVLLACIPLWRVRRNLRRGVRLGRRRWVRDVEVDAGSEVNETKV